MGFWQERCCLLCAFSVAVNRLILTRCALFSRLPTMFPCRKGQAEGRMEGSLPENRHHRWLMTTAYFTSMPLQFLSKEDRVAQP